MTRRLFPCLLGLALLLAACDGAGSAAPMPTAEVPIIAPTRAPALPTSSGSQPPEWAARGLSGRLVVSLGAQGIQQVDFATGEVKQLFAVPEGGWLTAASQAETDQRMALAYAAPPEAGQVQLGYTDIYLLPGDCAERPGGCTPADLTALVERSDPHEAYFSPVWAPDGRALYFAHFRPSQPGKDSSFQYALQRLEVARGQALGAPEHVLDDALWPAVSPDGTQITYVYTDPGDLSNHLFIAAADGSQPRPLTTPGMFEAVDAPLFSADGTRIFFSAVGDGPAAHQPGWQAWLDWLTGAQTASAAPLAHNVPSDWWQIPAGGGAPTRLTEIYETGLFGDLSPDGRRIAFLSAGGLYVMDVDGRNLQRLLSLSGFGTLEWVGE